jgi:hypothetical protein
LALGIKIIRNTETEIRNAEVEKVFGKAGLSPTVIFVVRASGNIHLPPWERSALQQVSKSGSRM